MLDEDENPVECTECIQRTCLQASALTETARIVSANEDSVLVWVTRTRRRNRRVRREKEGRERGRTRGKREEREAAGNREEETNWTARRSRRSYNALRSTSIKSFRAMGSPDGPIIRLQFTRVTTFDRHSRLHIFTRYTEKYIT